MRYDGPAYEEKFRKLIAMRFKGVSYTKAAKELGISRRTCIRWWNYIKANAEKFFPPTKLFREEIRQRLRELLDSNTLTPGQTARCLTDISRCIEPITTRIHTKGEEKLRVIVRPWGKKDGNNSKAE